MLTIRLLDISVYLCIILIYVNNLRGDEYAAFGLSESRRSVQDGRPGAEIPSTGRSLLLRQLPQ